MFLATLKNGVYHVFPKFLNLRKGKNVKANATILKRNNVALWHSRFAHICPELVIKTSQNESVRGIPPLKFQKFFCEPCQLNKQRRISFRALGYRHVKRPLERLFMDIWGPIKTLG